MSGIISQNVGRSSGLLKAVAVAAGGATDAEATNIMLNSFRICVNGGLTKQNMVDGVVDEFEDATGIDAGSSTNEFYDTALDAYLNTGDTYPGEQTVNSVDAKWTGDKANFTFSGADIYGGTTGGAALKWNTDLVGDFEINFTMTAFNTSGGWGVAKTTETFLENNTRGGMDAFTYSWFVNDGGSQYYAYGSASQGGASIANGSVVKIERVSGVIKIYDDGSLSHTFSQTTTDDLYFIAGADTTGGINFDSFSSLESPQTGGDALALFSNATTALAVPTDANIVIWEQDVDTITLNTDLKAYASRNGGTTYTQITLAKEATLTTGQILTGTVDISGQSSGTSMKYKITTAADNGVKIHAVALQWS